MKCFFLLALFYGSCKHDAFAALFSCTQAGQVQTPPELQSPPPQPESRTPYEKAWLVRKWYNFDVKYPLSYGHVCRGSLF